MAAPIVPRTAVARIRPAQRPEAKVSGMPLNLTWREIAVRLVLTVIAALALGFNRGEHGKAAGMRTVLLVTLAASVAMIQVNLLLPTSGRASDSFVMNDLMRLPLGILTGVGFIGGGAILRRGNIVTGVTTAATLWLATVVGLCFGGGQNEIGIVATILGLAALWPLGWLEHRMPRERSAEIAIVVDETGPGDVEIRKAIEQAGLSILGNDVSVERVEGRRKLVFRLRFLCPPDEPSAPSVLESLAERPGVRRVEWHESP